MKKLVYTCYDRFLCPFKIGCNCGKEFPTFSELQKHIKEKYNLKVPSTISRFFEKHTYG